MDDPRSGKIFLGKFKNYIPRRFLVSMYAVNHEPLRITEGEGASFIVVKTML